MPRVPRRLSRPSNPPWYANLLSVRLLIAREVLFAHERKEMSMNPDLRRRTDEVVSRLTQLRDSL